MICDPKDEDNDGLDEILHHGRRAVNNQLKLYVLELLPLPFILLILHKGPSLPFILLLDLVVLHHVFNKPSLYLLVLLVNYNLLE